MTLTVQDSDLNSVEQVMANLRNHYLKNGFSFKQEPPRELLPSFFGNYRPDAIAQKDNMNIAIEIKSRRNRSNDISLEILNKRFENHPSWHLTVVYAKSTFTSDQLITPSSSNAIRERLDKLREMNRRGDRQSAFVMAWSLLEATLQHIAGSTNSAPRTPGTVVQTLAMLGYIDPPTERSLRLLVQLRNRIVHGDLDINPSDSDVGAIFDAIEQALGG